MSSQQAERPITLDEALAQLQVLESQLARLQALVNDVEQRVTNLSLLEDALMNLRDGSDDALVPLDAAATVFARGSIKPLEKVVVHAGLDVYVELSVDKALDHVRKLRAEYSKVLDVYRRELAGLAQYYAALRSAVEQALAGRGGGATQ